MIASNESAFRTTIRAGYWSAIISFWAMAGYGVSQIAQVVGIVHAPLDAILIYATSLAIATPFMLSILALHHIAPVEKRYWSHAALLFAVMYNVFVTIMYVVQLAAVIPYNVTDPVLTVTPHSFFWTLDALGYISMGIATLFGSFVFVKVGGERRVKYLFIANAIVTPLIGLVYFYPTFSIPLLFMGFPWVITAPGSMFTLAGYFRKLEREGQNASAMPV